MRTVAGGTRLNAMRQTHAKPEFYANGVGWVPLEATEKTNPPNLFGCDHSIPLMVKCVDDMEIELPVAHFLRRNMIFRGHISLYQVYNLGQSQTDCSLVHWKVTQVQ